MINKVVLIGNLGRDPEVRRLENGAAVAQFSVATNENYKDKSGEWQTQTEWHTVVAWRNLAESVERNLSKGKLVYVEGKLTHRKYMDKDNIERYATNVVANVVRLLERREGTSNSNNAAFPTAQDAPPAPNYNNNNNAEDTNNEKTVSAGTVDAEGDDLPF